LELILTPLAQIKGLETQIRAVISKLDLAELPKGERVAVTKLRNDLTDAKLDIRDYEFSDTRAEQQKHAKQAVTTLESIRAGILASSEYNVFSAIDVAQFSAQLEQIIDQVT
jgi:hypothetical protein